MNVKMLKDKGISYFNPESIKDNLDIAGWFKNPCCDGKETIFLWTGQVFYRNVMESGVPFKNILPAQHVDHLGGGTWGENQDRIERFIKKYKFLLKI